AGSGIDVEQLNGRTYVDVTLPAPPANYQIDWTAVTATTPVFTLSGPGAVNLKVDTTQAPWVKDQSAGIVRHWLTGTLSAGDVTVRYQVTGVFTASGGAVTATCIPGSFRYAGPSATTLPTFGAGDLTTSPKGYVDVSFTPTSTTNPSSPTTISTGPTASKLTL